MITNTNNISSASNHANDALRTRAARPQTGPETDVREDTLSTVNSANMEAALASTPIIRPEVLARAQALATDPAYPPLQIIQKLSSMIIASNDLSNQE